MSTLAIPESKPVTLSFNTKEDAPLFLVGHSVFSGKAPRNYQILGHVQISVFETAATVNLIFTKMTPEAISKLPTFDYLQIDAPFWGKTSNSKIMPRADVTPEQKASLAKWVKEENIWTFPEVKEITYQVGPEEGVEISEEDSNALYKMVQERMALQFPSIKKPSPSTDHLEQLTQSIFTLTI